MNFKKILAFLTITYLIIGSIFASLTKPEQLWICPPFADDPLNRSTIGNYPASANCKKQTISWTDRIYQDTFMTVMWFPIVVGKTINKLSGGID